jgi:hypothetical protein
VAAIVTAGSGVLSWDALRWGAGELGIDPNLTWLYPVVADGMIAAATVGAVATRSGPKRTRAYVWTLLFAGIGISVVGNAAHASGGAELWGPITLHRLGSAVPALALAATLHLLVIIVRATGAGDVAYDAVRDRGRRRQASGSPAADGGEAGADDVPDDMRNPQARVPARAEVRRLLSRQTGDLSAHGIRRLAARVAERTGVSIPHARRLLGEERGETEAGRRPRLVDMTAEPVAAVEEVSR